MYHFCIFTDFSLHIALALYMLIVSTFEKASFFRAYRLYIFTNVLALLLESAAFSAGQELLLMKGLFYVDQLGLLFKIMITVFMTIVLFIQARAHEVSHTPLRFLLFAALCQLMLGMLILCQHFLLLLLCLVGITICLYVLIICEQNHPLSNEAALKYMIQSSIALAISLLGLSFLYGAAGSLVFSEMRLELVAQKSEIFICIGGVLFLLGVMLKLGQTPMHFWMVDVYQSASISTILLSSVVIKLGVLAIVFAFMRTVVWGHMAVFPWLIKGIALLSILWGALAALHQTNVMRFLAYSSIVQMGFTVLCFLEPGWQALDVSFHYFILYALAITGIFIVLSRVKKSWNCVEAMTDLAGLHKSMPGLALALAIFMLSLAGLPPLGGFFAKMFLLQSLMRQHDYVTVALLLGGILLSVAYYLSFIRIIYFEASKRPVVKTEFSLKDNFVLDTILISFILVVCLYPWIGKAFHGPLLTALAPYQSV